MADITLSVALITAGTSVVSVSVPLVINWARDAGRDKRAAAERLTRERAELARKKREQCVSLLRLTRDFRVLAGSVYGPHGSVSQESAGAKSAEDVRQSAADIASRADEIEFMVPGVDAEVLALAAAASHLVTTAEEKHREHGSALVPADFEELDEGLEKFKQAARATFGEVQELTG